MAGVNKVILLGNLGKDPVLRTLENGARVASFSLATNRTYKGLDGNPVEETEWHNIVLWGRLADLSEKYLTKGRQVYIEGRIKSRQWEDKEGNKRNITEIIGEQMKFIGPRPEGGDYTPKMESETSTGSEADQVSDDLPF